MSPDRFHSIAITGASAGLGRALALALAAPGRRLFLCARGLERLEAVAAGCRERGAEVRVQAVDMRDSGAAADWVADCDAVAPLDLLIANSGIFAGTDRHGRPETVGMAADLIATNLTGAVAVASTAAGLMAERGRGRIALISSLAAFFPHADAPAYSASKAGLRAYGDALREAVEDRGVGVTLVFPGHVDTAQTDAQKGPLPLLMPPDRAARRIVRALERGRRSLSFPLTLRVLVFLHGWLPWRLRVAINRQFRFHVDHGDGEVDGTDG